MKIIRIVTLTQIISWTVFILEDFFTENIPSLADSGYAMVSVLVLPVLVSILYLLFKRKIHISSIPDWVNTMTVFFIWITEHIFVGAIIGNLMGRGKWFIHQAEDGWGNLLNGIEYALFPLFSIIVPIGIVMLWNFGVWVYKKMN